MIFNEQEFSYLILSHSHPMSRNHKQPIFLEKNQFQKRKKILKELWHSICLGKYKIAVKKSEFIAKGH